MKLLIVADKFMDIKALNHHHPLSTILMFLEAESGCA